MESVGVQFAPQSVHDRREARQKVAPATSSRAPRVIAVVSGKGGVGKSNIAVNLGVSLVRRGGSVTLIDADVGTANADVLLGVQPRHSLRRVALGHCSLADVTCVASSGLRFVAGLSGTRSMSALTAAQRHVIIRQLTTLPADEVLVDCGAGVSADVLDFALAADALIVVTTPEPTALTGAYAAVKTLWHEGYRNTARLVVNMAESVAEAKKVSGRLCQVAHKFMNFSIEDGGYVLHDTHVELAVRHRVPFVLRYPKCSASTCVGAIADQMMSAPSQRKERNGLLRRVAGVFG